MNDLTMLNGTEPREILQAVIDKKIPAILSFLSWGKWHIAKVLLTSLGANKLNIQPAPRKTDSTTQNNTQYPFPSETNQKPYSIDIQVNQPVGIAIKYGYGKLVFETTVVAIESSSDPENRRTISLLVPDRIEMVQRRSYFRVNVPGSMKVNVMLWHRRCTDDQTTQTPDAQRTTPESYWQGRLADISAGGVQLVVEKEQKPDFRKGQFMGLRFTPMPYEMPLMFNAQIRNILPTADGKSICLGLRIIGLEASPEGRQVLLRLCNVVEKYYQMNQSSTKKKNLHATNSSR
ncbi:MAG: PilZ domain-containing protein [Sedimentisphaerales bacterium]|nr:PilZ domain-containing protein [Sedimentisphaerales bacterium]